MIVIGHDNNIPTMQFFAGFSKNTQPQSYILSLTECVWVFRNNALWDAHALFGRTGCFSREMAKDKLFMSELG